MFRRFGFALAMISALTGCLTAPPKGPFVEYSDGLAPSTRPVTYEATYALHSTADPSVPLAEHHVVRGESLGFRREADGSVLVVGPGYTIHLPPGGYSWDVVPGTAPSWRERVWRDAHDPVHALAEGAWRTAILTCGAAVAVALFCLYAFAYR